MFLRYDHTTCIRTCCMYLASVCGCAGESPRTPMQASRARATTGPPRHPRPACGQGVRPVHCIREPRSLHAGCANSKRERKVNSAVPRRVRGLRQGGPRAERDRACSPQLKRPLPHFANPGGKIGGCRGRGGGSQSDGAKSAARRVPPSRRDEPDKAAGEGHLPVPSPPLCA